MMRRAFVLAVVLTGLALSGCQTQTVLLESRRDASIGRASFGRVLVVVRVWPKPRKAAEDEFVRRLVGVKACPSYGFLEGGELASPDVERRALAEGFDALVVMAPVGASSLWRTPDVAGGPLGIPGNETVDIDFRVRLISLRDDREIFTCLIRRRGTDPLYPDVPSVSRAAVRQMRAEGLVD